jgi:CO/xanthine dehydrogenase FAD-binding subunit
LSVADLCRHGFVRARTLSEACGLVHEHRAKDGGVVLLAGGTDFLVEVSQRPRAPDPLPLVIDISSVDDLRGIDWDGRRLRIGAAATYLEMQRHPAVCEHTPLIARMSYDVGGPTIQARGTLGGNIATASPAADGVAAIAAYDPVVEVESVRGRRRIAMAELQTGYKLSSVAADEVIAAVEIVPPKPGSPWVWRKVGTRLAQAISKVALAGVAEVEAGRARRFGLGLASVAPVTALMPATRELVLGAPLEEIDDLAIAAAVERDISPIDDLRSTRQYRRHCAIAVVRSFVRSLVDGATR